MVGFAVVGLNGHSVRFLVRFFCFARLVEMPSSITSDNEVTPKTIAIVGQTFPDTSRKSPFLVPDLVVPNLEPFHRYPPVPGRQPESFHRYRPIRGLTPILKRGHGNRSLDLAPGVVVILSGEMHPASSELLVSNASLCRSAAGKLMV